MRAAQNTAATAPAAAAPQPPHTIIKQKHSRWWEVRDPNDELVCLTVYRKGADVVAVFQQVRGEAVPERVATYAHRHCGTLARPAHGVLGRFLRGAMVILPLAVADGDLAVAEVHVPGPQPDALH